MPQFLMSLTLTLLMVIFAQNSCFAEEFTYFGLLEQTSRNGEATPVKEFLVHCFSGSNESQLFYQTQEDRPALPWIERYGIAETSDALLAADGIAIAYRHKDRNYVLPVALPFFADFDKLEDGAKWKNEQGEFAIIGNKVENGSDCWIVQANTGIARTHQLYVQKASPIIERATQTVFMGPGDRFRMTFKRAFPAESTAKRTVPESLLTQLIDIKSNAERDKHDRLQPVSLEQAKKVASLRPALSAAAKETDLEKFVKEITDDVTTLLSRGQRVADLSGEMLNKPVGKFTLLDLQGKEISAEMLEQNVVVLHFWDYVDSGNEQPYGQIGYLDFTNNRWKDKEVVVIGVAVNSKLSDPESRAQAVREIKKLQQFMRLSYQLTIDGGAVLNSFGNPTRFGEQLPLWVVLSKDRKIVHYKTGYYEVDNRVGLKELDDAIEAALQ